MKRLVLIPALLFAASGSWATDKVLGGNPDLYKSPILEHDAGEKAHALQKGEGEEYGSQMIAQPADHSHGAEARQPGEGDAYGSVVYEGKQ